MNDQYTRSGEVLAAGDTAEGVPDVHWCHTCETFVAVDQATNATTTTGGSGRKSCPVCGEDWDFGVWFTWHQRCPCGRPGGLQAHHGATVTALDGSKQARCACGWQSKAGYKQANRPQQLLSEHLDEQGACSCECHRVGSACAAAHVGESLYPGDCEHAKATLARLESDPPPASATRTDDPSSA